MTGIRLSPSGPVIGNTGGAPLEFGPGARLRLAEAVTTMGGSQAIPDDTVSGPEFAMISPAGFSDTGANPALVLTLDNPNPALSYRAHLTLDIQNTTTNVVGEVTLYLDTSVDGGTTWTEQTKTGHMVTSGHTTNLGNNDGFQSVEAWLPMELGSALGVLSGATPSPSIKLRARAYNNVPNATPNASLQVSSEPTMTGISGLGGTIHMELEELF